MQRFKFPVLTILLTFGLLNGAVLACGGAGGYRGSYRPSYRPAVRYAAPLVVQRPVIHQQPIIHQQPVIHQPPQQPAIRPVSMRAPAPIRLAPTQVAQPVAAAPAQQPAVVGQPGGAALPASPSNAPATAPAATQQVNGPVGTWTAQANGQAKVILQLNADNTFEWIAENNGRTSRFRGNFQLAANKLTLARSSDNQKLVGAITFTNTGFQFKLDGANDAGLQFVPQSS